MRLTMFSDFTLRVLIYLAVHRDHLATTAEIAEAYDISNSHLMKVVKELGARGYVETLRGKGGGLRLRAAPEDISLGEVLRDTESGSALVECFDVENGRCCIAPACSARGILREAQDSFFRTLDGYTLADLLTRQHRLATLLAAPGPKRPRKT